MDMQQIMEQARLMQQQLTDAQENMGNIEVSATAGGGMVRVTATADMKLTSLSIDPEVVDPNDVAMLEDLVITAVNAVLAKANDVANDQVAGIAGGLNIPGLF
ncbi:MAG: YbaB/EbfC family nucleoid-associated protein [Coriobacteriales bacterium]|nr:YbaB/EbfC family nucleoid-associated protein [Coriobacteriales bacterium]